MLRLAIIKVTNHSILFNFAAILMFSCLIYVETKTHSNQKKILIWNPSNYLNCQPFDSIRSGNEIFEMKKCKFTNCFIYKNYQKLSAIRNSTSYDAIMFDGRLINDYRPHQLPKARNVNQLYIFVQLDSAAHSPVCNKYYNNYFNWTITYRLDSDIPWTYFKIKTLNNVTIGPKAHITWMDPDEMLDINENLKKKLQQKSRLACFISDCHSLDNDWIVSYLNDKLAGITEKKVDILYDTCRPMVCHKNESTTYHSLMERYHHFYMAIENSVDKDFVTNKLLTGLLHDTVPIVYGGADYTKFAPPGSYIDLLNIAPRKLSYYMTNIFKDSVKYNDFFKWRNHYYYEMSSDLSSVACELCEKLNQERSPKSYKSFRVWWNKDYKRTCSLNSKKDLTLHKQQFVVKKVKDKPDKDDKNKKNRHKEQKFAKPHRKIIKPLTPVNMNETVNGKRPIHILLWALDPYCEGCEPFDAFKTGNTVFKDNYCEFTNCFIHYKGLHKSTDYDAIIFNGRPIIRMGLKHLPLKRNLNQIYIFLSLESPDRFPICHDYYDDFFNWTITYRLDSDLPWPYFQVTSLDNVTIASKPQVNWIDFKKMIDIDDDLKVELSEKTKLAVWFVSNCQGVKSGRKSFVHKLNNELVRLGTEPVDVYGKCGPLKCPKDEPLKCNGIIKEYLFYLALENAISEDYVTEKVLLGYQNNAIPVVLGGADYVKFLPPNSYINAYSLGPKQLAQTMVALSRKRISYYQYFKWRNHYSFRTSWPICDLCAKLNGRKETKTYNNFRYWWNKNWWISCLEPSNVFKH